MLMMLVIATFVNAPSIWLYIQMIKSEKSKLITKYTTKKSIFDSV